jgi:hypothetical protein
VVLVDAVHNVRQSYDVVDEVVVVVVSQLFVKKVEVDVVVVCLELSLQKNKS